MHDMTQLYLPASNFLRAFFDNDVPLSGGEWAEENLSRLVQMTRDEDHSNRDWATFFLAQSDVDTAPVRDALANATQDEDEFVRAEAIWGLARRDRHLALPLVREALVGDSVPQHIFEAAALCAHASLIESLRDWAEPSKSADLDALVSDALLACERGSPTEL